MNRRGFLAGLAVLWAAKKLPAESAPIVEVPIPATTIGTWSMPVTASSGAPISFTLTPGVWTNITTVTNSATYGGTTYTSTFSAFQ